MKLDRLGDITSELSSSLVKSIVLPAGFLEWLSKPLGEKFRDKLWGMAGGVKATEAEEASRLAVPVGPMVLIGATPVPDEAIVAIIHLIGGRGAKLAVVPAASADPVKTGEEGLRFFTRFGMRAAEVVEITSRERADDPEWASRLTGYQAVFLCGPDAEVGLQTLQNTLCGRVLHEMQTTGKLVSGSGGGAALLAEKLIVTREGQDQLIDGLGLAPGFVIETTATQQARFGRLVKALSNETAHAIIGVDIDANAALVVCDGEAKVLGESTVTFLDPRDSTPTTDPNTMCGLKVHVLMAGFGMNLRTRKPMSPAKEAAQPAGES